MDNRISTKVKIAKNLMQFFLTRRVFAWRGSSSSHSVAITFDDGPNPQYTPECLNILKKLNVKGTFFIIGQHAEKYPELLQRIFDEGHSLGIHTYSHPFTFHQMKFSEIKEELEKTQNLIFRLTNKRVTLYRPPRGQLSIKLLLSTSILKFPTILWNVSFLDHQKIDTQYLLDQISVWEFLPGDIILLHDNNPYTLEALPALIQRIYESGLDVKPLPQLLNLEN